MIFGEMLTTTIKRIRKMAIRHQRPLRFLAIGAVNTAISYLIFSVLYVITNAHNAALIIATVLGIIFNYFSTGRIVFGNLGLKAFVPFVATYAVTVTINLILLNFLVQINVTPLIAQAICIPIVATISYFLNSRYVFQ